MHALRVHFFCSGVLHFTNPKRRVCKQSIFQVFITLFTQLYIPLSYLNVHSIYNSFNKLAKQMLKKEYKMRINLLPIINVHLLFINTDLDSFKLQ